MVPSRNTCAIPPQSPLNPIQLTPVPLKASVVVAFASLDSAPMPPLKRESDGKIHVPVKVTDGSFSSMRVVDDGGGVGVGAGVGGGAGAGAGGGVALGVGVGEGP